VGWRFADRGPFAWPQSDVFVSRNSDARARHWIERRDLQPGQYGIAEPDAVSRARTLGPDSGCERRRARKDIVARDPGYSRRVHHLRERGRLLSGQPLYPLFGWTPGKASGDLDDAQPVRGLGRAAGARRHLAGRFRSFAELRVDPQLQRFGSDASAATPAWLGARSLSTTRRVM